MTQEEKRLLIKDITARLSYGVKCQTKDGIGTLISIECSFGERLAYVDFGYSQAEEYDLNDGDIVKPYLRPMSSMTEEEKEEYWNIINLESPEMPVGEIPSIETIAQCSIIVLDWLLSKGFDIRCLIPMGLALEAPEEMYN